MPLSLLKTTSHLSDFQKAMGAKKLIIQIPCYNEAEQIGACLRALPREIPGYDSVETLVVDDGSQDATVARAREANATHILALGHHRGLAQAFSEGTRYAFLSLGAASLVNFDADLQYEAADIATVVAPLLQGRADYVLGERPLQAHPHFSPLKKALQKIGSLFVSGMCGFPIRDATTGFRALNREAGLRLSVWSDYTYTLETLVHAKSLDLRIASVPIRVSSTSPRPSRLLRSNLQYCLTSVRTVLLTVARYRPFTFFLFAGAAAFSGALVLGLRFLWYYMQHDSGKIQSVILCAVLMVVGVLLTLFAILAENISLNRRLLEDLRYENRLEELRRAR